MSSPEPGNDEDPRIHQDGSHQIAVQVHGDGNRITIRSRGDAGDAQLTFEPRHRRQRPIEKDLDLLDPYRCAVDLVGRDAELAALDDWLSDERPVSVRCLTGRAGSGKTRLALELCRSADSAGWQAGFVQREELARFHESNHASSWRWAERTLLVIDYAASAAPMLREWIRELDAFTVDEDRRLRVLLLERHAEPDLGWWGKLSGFGGFSSDVSGVLDPPEPVPLASLHDVEDRREILNAIMRRTSERQGLTEVPGPPEHGTNPEFDERLANPALEFEPLYLLMAGLTAVQHRVPHVLAWTRTDLAHKLAGREIERLRKLADSAGVHAQAALHVVAQITLSEGMTHEMLAAIAADELQAAGYSQVTEADVIGLLTDGLDTDAGGLLGVRPDLIGEGFCLRVLDTSMRSADAQAASVARIWEHRPAEVTATVIRTAQDFGSAVDHPSQIWLDRIVEESVSRSVGQALADMLPWETVNLRERALALWERLHAEAPADDSEQARVSRASSASQLSYRLMQVGRHEDALERAEEAVRLRRELAAARPDAFLPDLAASLNDVAARLSKLAHHERALELAEEALRLRRELAVARPEAFRPHLAVSLNNVAIMLSEVGRYEDALKRAEEALRVRRELAAAQPGDLLPDLAASLNNVAIMLSKVGRHEDALARVEEAMAHYRELAAARPDAFLPDLAMSLTNVANVLSNVGRHQDALECAEEAVRLRREMEAARPDAFRPNLAQSLNNLANMLCKVGRHEDALERAEEALRLRRKLAAARPGAFRPELAASINNVANMLCNVGRHEDALERAEESVQLYREVVAARPHPFLPDLAMSLSVLGHCLEAVGRLEEALAPDRESISVLCPFLERMPQAFARPMLTYLQDYLRRAEAAGQAPDQELVSRVMTVLQPMLGDGDGTAAGA